ncbi:MAG: hypothetical protein KC643_15830 [Nitrospira sp.]|nr:hypothetical protein [Nitrospira sp.]
MSFKCASGSISQKARTPFNPTREFWEDHEKKINASPDMICLRLRAIEWFRCESYMRARLPIYRKCQDEIEKVSILRSGGTSSAQALNIQKTMKKSMSVQFKELELILSGGHHWLIDQGPRPNAGWIYPYWLPILRKDFAVRVVKKPIATSPERLVLALDPRETDETILRTVNVFLKEHRETNLQKRRAPGAGKTVGLPRMWEALQAHDERLKGVALKNLSFSEHQKPTPQRGRGLLSLSEKMMNTATHKPQEWLDTFL